MSYFFLPDCQSLSSYELSIHPCPSARPSCSCSSSVGRPSSNSWIFISYSTKLLKYHAIARYLRVLAWYFVIFLDISWYLLIFRDISWYVLSWYFTKLFYILSNPFIKNPFILFQFFYISCVKNTTGLAYFPSFWKIKQ